MALVKGWRGEVCHPALTGDSGRFRRCKIIDASFHNWTRMTVAQPFRISRSATNALTFPTAVSIYEVSQNIMFVFDTIAHRLKRGCETMAYPKGPPPALPDRHGGALKVEVSKCADGCSLCVPVCPTQAIARPIGQPVALDLGRCIFCAACAIAGGPFVGNPQILDGAASVVPVDLHIPGFPPHPLTILDGLLRLLDKLRPEWEHHELVAQHPATTILPKLG